MKKLFFFFGMLIVAFICSPSVRAEEDGSSAEDKARELHRLASSDVIYQDQETKAIYYQNVQMIDLLKQIRDLLQANLKDSKE